MSTPRKQKIVRLPFAFPAADWRRPKLEEKVFAITPDGDPRDSATSSTSDFLVRKPFRIEPMLRSGFIPSTPLTPDECQILRNALGNDLNKEARDQIAFAIRQMIAATALFSRLPDWRDFEARLKNIVRSGRHCLKAAAIFKKLTSTSVHEPTRPAGVISLDQTVKTYISLYRPKTELWVNIAGIIQLCETALKEIKPKASQRGPRADYSFKLFLQSMFFAAQLAGASVTLPSNESKGRFGSQQTTPFFEFIRVALTMAIAKARIAIDNLPLSDEEKLHANSTLERYVTKSHGGLLETLRQAKKAALQSSRSK